MTIDEIKKEIQLCKNSLDFCIQAKSVPFADIKTWDESIAEWQYQITKWEQKLREVEGNV